MGKLLILVGKFELGCDVPCIDGDGCRMPSGVLIPGVKSRYERCRERKARSLQSFVRDLKLLGRLALFSIEPMESMGC